jgi:transcriptional regulator with XRE-family HTH domain
MTDIRQVLAANIRQYRKKLGLSQSKLAEKAETATNYIGMIETGKQFPSTEMMEKIAGALEIDTLELFSARPVPVDESLRNLKKEILGEIEKLVAARLQDFREQTKP